MSISSNKIELAAVNCITDAFLNSKRLETYIPTNDKEPVWDGHIYIKHGNKGISRIPTQVKGKSVKKLPSKPTFPVKLVNLENYKRDGGVIYFVVYITEDARYPYFRLLAPIDIKRIMKSAKGKAEASISLEPLGKVEGDLENQFIQFYYDCKKQTSTSSEDILSMEDAIEKGYTINFQVHDIPDEKEAYKYLTSHYTYLYATIENKGIKSLFPIGDQPYKLFFLPYVKGNVSCGGQIYFTKYQDGRTDDKREIHIDGFIRMIREKDKEVGKLDINLCQNNLQKFYHQLSFVNAMSKERKFFLGDEEVRLNEITARELKDITCQFEYWEKVIKTLQILNVDISRLDISSFQDKDFRNLDMLRRAILDKQEIANSQDVSGVTTVPIGPYRILILAERQESGKYKLTDFFKIKEGKVFAVEREDGNKMIVSFYSAVLERGDLHHIINIDYADFIASYEDAAKYNRNISEQSNQDVLCLVRAYDKAMVKDERLLEYAIKLTDWISNLPETDNVAFVYRLNRLQILKRLNRLSEREKEELIEISESDIPAFGKWAANLLLEDYARADRYWKQMTEEEQESYRNYPIYKFEQMREDKK